MGNTQEQNEPADKAQCPEQSTVPKNSGQIYTCTDCGLTGCRKEDGNYPPYCLTMQTESGELDEIAALYASDSIDGTIARASAKIEGNYYCRKTRVEETVLPEEDKIKPGTFEPMCNPVLQARYLNRAGTDLNIVIGLCVGHDALFNKHSEAPVTTLIAKDRVLGHNPVAALYCHYYDKLYKP